MFVINFEEYYVLKAEPMPTRFMRFAKYEDFLIDRLSKDGCNAVIDDFEKKGYDLIVERRVKKGHSQIGDCATELLATFADSTLYNSYLIPKKEAHAFSKSRGNLEYRAYPTVFQK
ncbi:MAG: hypothetical protein Roseis2KO_57730 [Roseivirga sp.]